MEGDAGAAWELFLGRYRRLILATTRRLVHEEGETFEVFEHVQARLLADDLSILRRFQEGPAQGARFSTWLVAVVHNLVIDWVRHRDGRRRVTMPAGLSRLQQQIYAHVFIERRSHAESYGLISAQDPGFSHSAFLRELAGTYRAVEQSGRGKARRLGAGPLPAEPAVPDGTVELEARGRAELLARVLDTLPTKERLALQLYVVEEMPAAEVAVVLGWPNAKWVYNRVYRGLRAVRRVLEERGLGREDL